MEIMIDPNSLLGQMIKHKQIFNILLELSRNPGENISRVAKETDITYPHTTRLVGLLYDNTMIRRCGIGRQVNLYLTKKGQEFTNIIIEFLNLERRYDGEKNV